MFECGSYDMAVTAKPVVGVVLCCNSCGVRGKPLFEKAVAAGFDLGPGPDRRRRPDLSKLQPASEAALARLKRAERRVLAFLSTQTRTREWFEASRRLIVETCHVSARDVIPLLKKLAERALIRIRSNNYKLKRYHPLSKWYRHERLHVRICEYVEGSVPVMFRRKGRARG